MAGESHRLIVKNIYDLGVFFEDPEMMTILETAGIKKYLIKQSLQDLID